MALPRHIRRKDLDDGVANLVINLNKIPKLNTRTTCEGHIWRDTPAWPTKNGWIHFYTEKSAHKTLVDSINTFCEHNNYFDIAFEDRPQEDAYTIEAKFEDHTVFDYFHHPKELADYYTRAEFDKKHIFDGWNELNKLVVKYIKKYVSPHINNLSYYRIEF